MLKFLFLLILSKPYFLILLEDNSLKIDLIEIPSKTYTNSMKWIGFSLSSPHIITKISWSIKDQFSQNEIFGIFEGSNDPTFIDSIPIYMFTEQSNITFIQIESKSSFKYIRYVSPMKKDIHITNIEVYGYKPKKSEQNEDKLYQITNIPLIVVNTEGKINYNKKTEKTPCTIIIINNGKISTKQTGTINIRGNSSKSLDKKPFRINFDKEENILDMKSKAKNWVLLANHMDKSLIRNLIAFKISSLLGQKYSPECKPINLIVDGSFEGNYIICDKIEKLEGRVELDSMNQACNEYPEITGGYLMEIDSRANDKPYHFTSKKGVKVTINYPDTNKIQTKYIKNWFDDIEENIYNNQNIDKIDLESFSQYFILEEFCADIDSVFSSFYFTKQRNDDKMYFGPAWDFDLSLDNDVRLYPTNSKKKWIFTYGGSSGTFRKFISKLMSCEDTLKAVQQKWRDIIMNSFTKEKVLNFIEEQIQYLDESIKLNFKRWKILNKILRWEAKARGSYEKEIKHLKEFIEERFMVFGNMILSANTTSFEIKEFWPDWYLSVGITLIVIITICIGVIGLIKIIRIK